MHYIKCSKCGQLITVKSEFMVLCPSCNKKLDNSFREWQSKNPNKPFTTYLSEVCVNELAIKGVDQQKRITKKIGITRNLKRMSVALIVALIAVVAAVGGYWFYQESQKGASIKAIMDDTWKINYYQDLGVTLKFPFALNEVSQMSDTASMVVDSTQTMLSFVSRTWSREGVTSVSASRIEYAPAFGVNREAATSQILQSIIQNNEMKGFETVPSDYSMGPGVKARMFSGGYLIKAQAYQFRAIMVIKDDTVWYFMVSYFRSMPEGTLLADKFFKGILI